MLAIPVAPAFAATTQSTVAVNHAVYLRTDPNFYSARVALETTGTNLKLDAGSTYSFWHVTDSHGRTGYVDRSAYYTALVSTAATTTGASATQASRGGTAAPVSSGNTVSTQLPPGVRYDASVHAIAPPNSTNQQKFNAILQVAEAQLGTPYVWGTSKDRGQNSFDCSNFTAYVYHHALGYSMSGASQTQYHSVGWPVPKSAMQPGDLLVFDQGGHVGIYIGNGEMIQEGGGLGKVGYLKVSPGSYWYNHLTVVKQMYQ
ncbi:C40 family peptidase [Alicyclobacillus sp. ALC3]|nr:C40 family peptidase [Alicyclobacillus sp. ALC3]